MTGASEAIGGRWRLARLARGQDGLGPRSSEASRWLSSPEGGMGDLAASASTIAAR